MTQLFSDLREIAHASVAILGALAMASGLIVTVLSATGVHVTDEQVVQGLGAAGGVAVLISKLIDSANDAIVSPKPVSLSAPGTVSFTTGPTPPVATG